MIDLNGPRNLVAHRQERFDSLTKRVIPRVLITGLGLLLAARAGAQTFTNLHSFTGNNNGYQQNVCALVQGSDGEFYGTTGVGGTHNSGSVFKISVNGTLTTLYSFSGGNDGYDPLGGLVQGSDGRFYGATGYGGPNNSGTLFKITTNGVLTTFHPFNNGQYVFGPLVQGADGSIYGTSDTGSVHGGTVFKINTNGALINLHTFTDSDGASPNGGLVQGRDGDFYGTTALGGANNDGTVFKINANGALTTLHSFNFNEGYTPEAGLVQGRDGNFYGTTAFGGVGTSRYGSLFKISTNGVLTTLYSFSGGNDGDQPISALVQGGDGDFYGTTSLRGATTSGDGTLFRISATGTLTTLYSFTGGNDGGFAAAGLIQGSDGKFYGTTGLGGDSGVGNVFSLTLPSPPPLSITPFAANVILSWPTNATRFPFSLQCTTNLVSPAVWTTVSPASVVVSGQNIVTNPIAGPGTFYRLSQ